MENDSPFPNIQENTKHRYDENTALAQINNTSRQNAAPYPPVPDAITATEPVEWAWDDTSRRQITNNNSNSTNNYTRLLTVDQHAKRRCSKTVISSQQLLVFIPFLIGCDVT
ncbi:hypothetical protein AVEN_38332-1 [Araneus ventricosus]|uniref:Uncharacterized protein n=1 Tax=Araneus ventricosus TaxID=182803 RepID=A0A4Y2TU15_ARAVE|nr:hypothetical protein AVEN_38332-1 [Araneus ventricosus]